MMDRAPSLPIGCTHIYTHLRLQSKLGGYFSKFSNAECACTQWPDAGEIAMAGSRRLRSTLAAAPVLFAHTVVTVAKTCGTAFTPSQNKKVLETSTTQTVHKLVPWAQKYAIPISHNTN